MITNNKACTLCRLFQGKNFCFFQLMNMVYHRNKFVELKERKTAAICRSGSANRYAEAVLFRTASNKKRRKAVSICKEPETASLTQSSFFLTTIAAGIISAAAESAITLPQPFFSAG